MVEILNLPYELLHHICIFLELKDVFQLFLVNKSISKILEMDQFWYQVCNVNSVDLPKSKKERKKGLKEWFRTQIAPSILFLYSSIYLQNEQIIQAFLKEFPSVKDPKKFCHFWELRKKFDVLEKEPTLKTLKKYNCICVFGGNPFPDREKLGDILQELIETTSSGVITLMWVNSGGNSGWHLGGKWENVMNTNGNVLSIDRQCLFKTNHRRWHDLKYSLDYSQIESTRYIALGDINPNCRIVGSWQFKKKKSDRSDSTLQYIAIAESCTKKSIHLNFSLCNQTIGLVFKCVKYIIKRKKVIEGE